MYKILSLFTLALFASVVQAEQLVTVPELEGGFTASIGTFYATPSTTNQGSGRNFTTSTDLGSQGNPSNGSFGTQGSIGYNFNNTANGTELSYRGLQ